MAKKAKKSGKSSAKKSSKKAAKKTAKKSVKKAVKKVAKKSVKKMTKMATPAMKKPAPKKPRMAAKRELIDTGTDKRYVRRDIEGQFKESDDVSRSLSADARQPSMTDAAPGMGDQGD